MRLAAIGRLVVGHREREPDRDPRRPGPDGLDGQAVRDDEDGGAAIVQRFVDRPGREHPHLMRHAGDDVRFVDRAGPTQDRCEPLGRPVTELAEEVGGVGLGPSALVRQPSRGREVVEGDDRLDAVLEQRLAEPYVVVERRGRPLALLRLDAAPLDRESIGGESELGGDRHVVAPAVPRVAGVTARLDARAVGSVLPLPPVVVPVAALDLVGCRRRPPLEAVGKLDPRHRCPPSVPRSDDTVTSRQSIHDTLSERGAGRHERCRRLVTRSRCRPTTGPVDVGESHHAERVDGAEEAGDGGDEERDLEERFRASVLMSRISS